ncbi:response regulator transcription factor [Roseateles depolymerans]|uniref:LuxR family transcriptional regulator n=1 Tax=Roseateles depolymerans TaxID=76731 RepID=A0A0U3MYG6_9BURK|nr:response regulator transcription factor [Roseateles depolymerans]ALV08051.1 LuxR family transcriptional regulator [Roseateles depolymerans]REG21728.1 LuxR family two component transcriptional regulator [Roseateles depolymerans]
MNAQTSVPDSSAPAGPVRILLVDDHPLVREGVRSRLQGEARYLVVGEAGSAEEAMVMLVSTQPQVVLLDVGLRGQSGIQLAQTMLERQADLRVLMYSMYDNPEYVQRALQAGARGYVLKDAPGGEIVAAIDAVAAGGTFLSPGVSRRMFRNQQPRPLLSPRESEILTALGRGESSKQIAKALNLSVRTVETHRQNIKRKLELDGQADLIRYAVEHARGLHRDHD